jgi:hypothetical protein
MEGAENVEREGPAPQQILDAPSPRQEVGTDPEVERSHNREPQATLDNPLAHGSSTWSPATQEIEHQVGIGDYEAVSQLIQASAIRRSISSASPGLRLPSMSKRLCTSGAASSFR